MFSPTTTQGFNIPVLSYRDIPSLHQKPLQIFWHCLITIIDETFLLLIELNYWTLLSQIADTDWNMPNFSLISLIKNELGMSHKYLIFLRQFIAFCDPLSSLSNFISSQIWRR